MIIGNTTFGTAPNDRVPAWTMGKIGDPDDSNKSSLGDNGSSAPTYKYVVLNKGYAKDDHVTTTNTVPLDVSTSRAGNPYKFIAWYNKAGGAGTCMLSPGEGFTFPDTNTIHTLSATWARLEASDSRVPYDGSEHTIDTVSLDVRATSDLINKADELAKLNGELDIQYTLDKVEKQTADGFETVPVDLPSGPLTLTAGDGQLSASISGLPGVTDVGRYKYTVKVTITDKVGGYSVELTKDVYLTIDPQLKVMVKKTVNGEWTGTDKFSFNMVLGAGASGASLASKTAVVGKDDLPAEVVRSPSSAAGLRPEQPFPAQSGRPVAASRAWSMPMTRALP